MKISLITSYLLNFDLHLLTNIKSVYFTICSNKDYITTILFYNHFTDLYDLVENSTNNKVH